MHDINPKHAQLKRRLSYGSDLDIAVDKRGTFTLEERDPSLINLPFPIPSIPILGPLLSPLIGGTNPTSTHKTSTAAATPTSTTGSSSGGGSNGGGGSSGDNGGSSSGGSSGGGNSGSSSGGTSSGNSGSSGGSSSGNSSGSAAGGSSGSTGSSSGSSSGGSSSGSSSGGSSDGSSGGASPGEISSGGGVSGGSNEGSSSGSSGASSSGAAAPAGAQSASGSAIPSGALGSTNNLQASSPADATGGVASSGSSGTISGALSKQTLINVGGGSSVVELSTYFDGTSTHVVTAAVAAATGSHSSSSGSKGTGSGGGSGSSSGSGSNSGGTDGGSDGGSPGSSSPSSAKSSGVPVGAIAGIVIGLLLLVVLILIFILRRRRRKAKAESHERWMSTDSRGALTPAPEELTYDNPFADTQMVQTSGAGTGTIAALPAAMVADRDPFSNAHRISVASSSSSHSSGEGQSLLMVHSEQRDSNSPMSVRPFSISESFNFPKPPGSEWGGSRPDLTASWRRESSASAAARSTTPVSYSSDPFADSVESGPVAEAYTLVQRAFVPSLKDELAVNVGERVKLLRAYDDGWVLVEKATNDLGEGAGGSVRGLVPVHCIRAREEGEEELPGFLASRRTSSYAAYEDAYA